MNPSKVFLIVTVCIFINGVFSLPSRKKFYFDTGDDEFVKEGELNIESKRTYEPTALCYESFEEVKVADLKDDYAKTFVPPKVKVGKCTTNGVDTGARKGSSSVYCQTKKQTIKVYSYSNNDFKPYDLTVSNGCYAVY